MFVQVLLPLLGLLYGSLLGLLSLLRPQVRPPLQIGRKKQVGEKEFVREAAAGQDEEGTVEESFKKASRRRNHVNYTVTVGE